MWRAWLSRPERAISALRHSSISSAVVTMTAASSMLFCSQSNAHSDDAGSSRYLELEVGVARDGHEFNITWLPQDDFVGLGEADPLEGEHLSAVVACVSEGDKQINLPKGDGLLARDHSIEWVRAVFELLLG
jgi:hypothetical protein